MGNSASVAKSGLVQKASDYPSYDDDKPRWVMHKDDVAHIRYAETGMAAREEDGGCPSGTVMGALKKAAEKWGSAPALRVEAPLPPLDGKTAPPSAPRDSWKTWTYSEYYNDCRRAAKGYLALGATRYDGVTILGFNSPEWFMAELAAMMMGGKAAGIYPTDTPAQIQFKAALSDASVAVVDSKANFDKFVAAADELPYLKAVVNWGPEQVDNFERKDGSKVRGISWGALLELGDEGDDAELDALTEATEPGNCACLVFTSGTTGNPKAVMVSHDALMYESYAVVKDGIKGFGDKPTQERIISYLPLSHVAGMMVDIISPIQCTANLVGYTTVHFARPYDLKVGTLGARLAAVQPTIFLGVPRVWEKISEKLKAVGAQTTGLKKVLSTWAKGQGLEAQKARLLGGSGAGGVSFAVANVLLGAIKKKLGLDQCIFMFSGAAPLTRETLEYFASLNININEVYGMSECTGATTWSTDACHKWTSIGYEMPGTEVKIFEVKEDGSKRECAPTADFDKPAEENQGEVCFRGRHIMMGYLCNPKLGEEHVAEMKKKNAETIDADGWLHSGDKGSKDTDNMFRITGRYKELIITAGGENIAPVPIEGAIKKNCPVISNVMMVGDKRKFNICLVTLLAVGATGEQPGTDKLDGAAASLVEGVSTIPEASASPEFVKVIEDAIKATNADGSVCPSNASKVQKFTILPQDFSVETGEITPSLKLKRSVVAEKYADIIEAVYQSKDTFVPYSSA